LTCEKFNINILDIQNYQYSQLMNEFSTISPYFIKTSKYANAKYNNIFLNSYISGYDGYSLFLISSIFNEIELWSASFMKYHIHIFNWLNIKVKHVKLPLKKNMKKNDFGCIIINENALTVTQLNTLSKLGDIMHFSQNKTEFSNLAKRLFNNQDTRFKFVAFDNVYKSEYKEYKIKSITKNLNVSHAKSIYLSYLNSQLSTEVNLQAFTIWSVDIKHSIFFPFLSFDDIKSDNDFKQYIFNQIIENAIQKFSIFSRNKGDSFKFFLLNRVFGTETLQRTLKDLLSYKTFEKKFKYFKMYIDVPITQLTMSYLHHLKKKNKFIIVNEYLNETPKPIRYDIIKYIQTLKTEVQNKLMKKITRKEYNIKSILKKNKILIESDWIKQFKKFKYYTIKIHITESSIYITCLSINTNKIINIHLKLSNQPKKNIAEFHKLKNILKNDTILLGFNSKKFEAPILNYLIKQKIIYVKSCLDYIKSIKKKNKIGTFYLDKTIFKFIDLRSMCKPKCILSLNHIGSQLNYHTLPEYYNLNNKTTTITTEDIKNNLCHSAQIIKELYLNLFQYNELLIYDAYVEAINYILNLKYNFKTILDCFTLNPTQKWSNLHYFGLNLKISKISNTELKTDKILKYIDLLDWNNQELVNELKTYYTQFFDNYKKNTIFKNNRKYELSLKINNLHLNVKNGGIHSNHSTDIFIDNTQNIIWDIRIESFHASVLYNLKLLKDISIQPLFTYLYIEWRKAFENNDYHKVKAFKNILTTLSGNLASSWSPLYNMQIRFDLIQISQIIICHLIDTLFQNKCEIYGVNIDGLIITSKSKEILNCLNIWANEMNFKLKINELKWFCIKSNKITKLTIQNTCLRNGLNLDENINFNTSFRFNKPGIIKDIIQGIKFDREQIVSRDELKKFIFTVRSTVKETFILKSLKEHKKIIFLRYIIGNKTDIVVLKKLKNTEKKIHDNIIPLNKFQMIKYKDLNLEFYENLATNEISKNINNLNIKTTVKKKDISNERDIIELKQHFQKFKKNADFVPVRKSGKFMSVRYKVIFYQTSIHVLKILKL